MLFRKRINYVAPMLASAAILLLLLSGYFELPSISSLSTPAPLLPGAGATRFPTALDSVGSRDRDPFTSVLEAFNAWDAAVGCPRIRAKLAAAGLPAGANATAQASAAITGGAAWVGARCEELSTRHVGVLVKGWTWIPDALDGVYTCRCGVSCVWSKSAAAVDRPDALLFEGATPPLQVPPDFSSFLSSHDVKITFFLLLKCYELPVYDELITVKFGRLKLQRSNW